jgi:DNA-binding NtrC family response regulator
MVAEGSFREDLYYRLCGVTLDVPSLRDRVSDISLLSEHLLKVVAKERRDPLRRLSPAALDVLERHSWPGNVRELDNVLRAASLFAEHEEIGAETVMEQLRPSTHPPPADTEQLPTDDVAAARVAYDEIRNRGTSLSDLKRNLERECIQRALSESGGNITKAASLLGMKRPRLSQLVKQYGLLESPLEGN